MSHERQLLVMSRLIKKRTACSWAVLPCEPICGEACGAGHTGPLLLQARAVGVRGAFHSRDSACTAQCKKVAGCIHCGQDMVKIEWVCG
jgi:hypothetical protein